MGDMRQDMRRDAERTGPRNGPSTRTGPALPLVKRPFAADAFGLWIVVCAHFPGCVMLMDCGIVPYDPLRASAIKDPIRCDWPSFCWSVYRVGCVRALLAAYSLHVEVHIVTQHTRGHLVPRARSHTSLSLSSMLVAVLPAPPTTLLSW